MAAVVTVAAATSITPVVIIVEASLSKDCRENSSSCRCQEVAVIVFISLSLSLPADHWRGKNYEYPHSPEDFPNGQQ